MLRASIELKIRILISAASLIAVLIAISAKGTVTGTIGDERTVEITQHSAVATLLVRWIVFLLVSIVSSSGGSATPSLAFSRRT